MSTTIALVDCSGCSWYSSDSETPMRSASSKRQELRLVFELRAGRIAEGIARAAIALGEHLLHVAVILGGETQLGADALMGIFRHRLGHLHRQAVQIEIILVAVVLEPFARDVGGFLAHGHDLQADDVALVIVHVAEEIGDALAILASAGAAG